MNPPAARPLLAEHQPAAHCAKPATPAPSDEEKTEGDADGANLTRGESDAREKSQPDPGNQVAASEGSSDTESVEPGEGAGTQRASTRISSLDADQREKWLQRVQDDPSRALRSVASGGRRKSYPTW